MPSWPLSLAVAALAVATPLHDAAERNDVAAILALLGAGADPNAKDGTYGWSPLHWAAYRGDTAAIVALVGAGANPNTKDDTGRIPLLFVNRTRHPRAHDVLLAHMRTIPNPEFLLTAAANGDFDTVIALLRVDTDPNEKDRNGWSPLHWAVFRGHTQATAALLGAGADPNMKNNAGQTAIDLAETATSSRESIIAILRRERAMTLSVDSPSATPQRHRHWWVTTFQNHSPEAFDRMERMSLERRDTAPGKELALISVRRNLLQHAHPVLQRRGSRAFDWSAQHECARTHEGRE